MPCCTFAAPFLAAATLTQDPNPAPTPPPPAFDIGLLAGLKARSIGPGVCSGRIGAVAGVPGQETAIEKGGKGNPEYSERLQRYKARMAPAPR